MGNSDIILVLSFSPYPTMWGQHSTSHIQSISRQVFTQFVLTHIQFFIFIPQFIHSHLSQDFLGRPAV